MAAGRRKKVADREEAELLLAEWRASGVSLTAFAGTLGIDGRSLNCWRRNLARREQPRQPQPLRLLELASTAAPPREAATYRVQLGGIEVVVGDDFREDTLERLLKVVAQC